VSRVPSGLQREKDGRDKVSRELENWKAEGNNGKRGSSLQWDEVVSGIGSKSDRPAEARNELISFEGRKIGGRGAQLERTEAEGDQRSRHRGGKETGRGTSPVDRDSSWRRKSAKRGGEW